MDCIVQVFPLTGAGPAREELRRLGVSEQERERFQAKAQALIVKIAGLSKDAAEKLLVEVHKLGGAAISDSEDAVNGMLVGGNRAFFADLLSNSAGENPELAGVAAKIRRSLNGFFGTPRPQTVKGTVFNWGSRTYIMGIINITPDSFSGDGLAKTASVEERINSALRQAEAFAEEGADLLDIGGESTRPGAQPVSIEEELARVIPVLRQLAPHTRLPVSVDTQKAVVAEAALKAGADIVNDIWGLQGDPDMARVVADYGATVVVMHNRRAPGYRDLLREVIQFFETSLELAERRGIPRDRVWLDPGIGFGKTREDNLELLRRLDELKVFGLPVLLGTSRKSVIGLTLNLPVEERLEGTAATIALGAAKGADLVRVHDVKAMARTARMADAIVRRENGEGNSWNFW